MFIIKAKKNTGDNVEYYMMYSVGATALSDLLQRSWQLSMSVSSHRFLAYKDAENLIIQIYTNANPVPTWWMGYDMYICEIDSSDNIINETKFLSFTRTPNTNKQDDDIDYTKPGEALKAHKQGKVVDWKKVANKKG